MFAVASNVVIILDRELWNRIVKASVIKAKIEGFNHDRETKFETQISEILDKKTSVICFFFPRIQTFFSIVIDRKNIRKKLF